MTLFVDMKNFLTNPFVKNPLAMRLFERFHDSIFMFESWYVVHQHSANGIHFQVQLRQVNRKLQCRLQGRKEQTPRLEHLPPDVIRPFLSIIIFA
ncbi:hypothetical protein CDAR_412031 [Caerostris darwini]|uniref:Uncharacterized protein n=1 Tax=Caerostris darwini TaxID=1538125 RepID=A0AAV4WC24_9ARAC|nr:hypothetical protein CDAR_412031 [Caerostris darwini]